MSNGRKYFYASSQDYIKHNENTIVFNYDTDDNNNTIKYITDVNNTIIS